MVMHAYHSSKCTSEVGNDVERILKETLSATTRKNNLFDSDDDSSVTEELPIYIYFHFIDPNHLPTGLDIKYVT
jgi:hypothetical protein